MALLLYCVVHSQAPAVELPIGAAGSAVLSADLGDLRTFYSELDAGDLQGDVRARAVEFNRVIAAIFARCATLSFRFPTVFANREDMTRHLGEKSAALGNFLREHGDDVEMEIRLASPPSASAAQSGTEYLSRRAEQARELDSAVQTLRACAAVIDWRQRPATGGMRCYVLLRRRDVASWRAALSGAVLPATVQAVVSGPWPPSEFLEPGS